MKNSIKRVISLLTALILLIGSIPVSIMAQTSESSNGGGITIDLSKTGESVDEILNNISGLNALTNGEESKKYESHSEEELTKSIEDKNVAMSTPAENEKVERLEPVKLSETLAIDFEYMINDNEVTITCYIGSSTEVVIPAEIERCPVRKIGNFAFLGCSSLMSITIPEGVTSIGNFAFSSCSALTSITIPEGVTSIGDSAFSYCHSLTSIIIPEGVTSIGNSAFSYCHSLTSIIMSEGVTNIGNSAFYACNLLTDVYYTGIEKEWNDINIGDFENEALFNAIVHFLTESPVTDFEYTINDDEVTITGYIGSATEVVIPAEIEGYPVRKIGDDAFAVCNRVTMVIIPYGVTSIGDYAFEACWLLSNVIIPDSVVNIGVCAFRECRLTSVTIPNSVTDIGDFAFGYCDFNNITIPDSVVNIGTLVFCGCMELTNIRVSQNNTNYCSDNGVLFNKNKTKLICYPEGKNGVFLQSLME